MGASSFLFGWQIMPANNAGVVDAGVGLEAGVRALLLDLEQASESPGEWVKTQILRPQLQR